MSNLVVLQSGGPTSVLNASLVGIIREARNGFDEVYGSPRGFTGLMSGNLVKLSDLPDTRLDRLTRTPSAALGTSRLRPTEEQLRIILTVLADQNLSCVIGIGGNDTADSLERLAVASSNTGQELQTIGLPKTIDNDLAITDHSLGYPSAARVVASFTRNATIDTIATASLYRFKIIEVMGRNAGWLAAAGTLWIPPDMPQPIVALPERPMASKTAFVEIVQQQLNNVGFAVAVIPETMRWEDGEHVSGGEPEWVDAFGHPYHGSAGQALLKICGIELGLRGKLDRPGSITRSSIELASEIDIDEAIRAGARAIVALRQGENRKSVVIRRLSTSPYRIEFDLAPLQDIANVEVRMPDNMIDSSGTNLTPAFKEYALPFVGQPEQEYETIDLGNSL